VFFDGPPPGPAVSAEFQMGGVRVHYSGSRTADEAILARVKPGDTVVTADRDLAIRCRSLRAHAVNPREFLGSLKPTPGGHEAEKPSDTAVDVDEWMDYFKR
jgi:Uncharacterized BCR, YaiI/YqxD family COG1671